MRHRLTSLFFVFLLAATAMAQLGIEQQQNVPGVKLRSRSLSELYASQKVLLSSFCRLDFDGARLQPTGWNRMKAFTSLKNNPEFERVVVVVRFDVESPERPSETVHVNYTVVGYYDVNDGYTKTSTNDYAAFHVQEQNGDLVVTQITPTAPHVSTRAALEWMNLRLNDPNTTEPERAHLKDAIGQLSKLVPQPRTTAVTP